MRDGRGLNEICTLGLAGEGKKAHYGAEGPTTELEVVGGGVAAANGVVVDGGWWMATGLYRVVVESIVRIKAVSSLSARRLQKYHTGTASTVLLNSTIPYHTN